jgi:hypothetical protein
MHLKIAAIRSGSEPVGKLPGGAFHRWLETPLACPKCEVTYNLVADWDQANDRWFAEESGALIQRLRKAVLMSHGTHHRVTHFETSGVGVISVTAPEQGK